MSAYHAPERDGSWRASDAILAISADRDEVAVAELRQAVIAFNQDATGHVDGAFLDCLVKNDADELVAGLSGFTWGGYGMIEWLWVRADQRGQRLGRRLVEAAEIEAARRGCRSLRVDSHSFQAPDFYDRLGYRVIATVDGTPHGHAETFFVKRLADVEVNP